MTITLCALAHAALAFALLSPRLPSPEAVVALMASAALAMLAACRPRSAGKGGGYRFGVALMAVVVAAEFGLFVLFSLQRASQSGAATRPMWPAFGAIGLGLVGYATRPLARGKFPLILAAWGLLGGWVIVAWPAPTIDLLLIQEDACHDLLRGRNPYASEHPRVPWKPGFDAESARAGDHMRSYSYPPLSLLMTVPGYLVGDVRWSMLAADLASAAILVAIGRRLGLPAGHPSEIAAAGVLCHPWGLPVLEASYTEPFLLLAVAASVWAMLGGRDRARGWAVAATLGAKQYGFLVAIPLAFARRPSARSLLLVVAVVAAINGPFYLADPASFRLGLIDELREAPVRRDSLSLPAMLNAIYGVTVPPVLGYLASAAALALVLARARGLPSRGAAGAAAMCLVFFATSKAGHLNYYWFASALIWLAVILACGERRSAVSSIAPSSGSSPSADGPRSAA